MLNDIALPKNAVPVITLLLCLSTPHFAVGQRNLYFLGGMEISGLNYNYKSQQGGSVLNRGWVFADKTVVTGQLFGFNASLCYQPSPKIAIALGLQMYEMDLAVYDTRFQQKNNVADDGTDNLFGVNAVNGNFDFAYWYSSVYVSTYLFPGKNRHNVQVYFNPGIAYNYFSAGHANETSNFYYAPTGENLELTAHYAPRYVSGFLETGIYVRSKRQNGGRYGNDRNRGIGSGSFIGLRYYLAGNMLSGSYKNVQNGNVLYTDQVTASGSYMSLTFKTGIRLYTRGPGKWRSAKRSTHPKKKEKKSEHHQNTNTRGF